MQKMQLLFSLVLAIFSLCMAAANVCTAKYNNIANPSPLPDAIAPESFAVSFSTNVIINGAPAEPIVMLVNRSWAPLGVDRFYSLILDGYYNCAGFFRVVPDFVLQYGIAATSEESTKWNTNIPDDPVTQSNLPWTVSYATAGPNTRTSQIFINYIDNSRLDSMGFAPFATVISGFDTALQVVNPTPGDSNGIDQDKYYAGGNEWLLTEYPQTSLAVDVVLV